MRKNVRRRVGKSREEEACYMFLLREVRLMGRANAVAAVCEHVLLGLDGSRSLQI